MIESRHFFMIHKFKFENTNFVIDVNSGSIHIVDDVLYDMLDLIDKIIDSSESGLPIR